MGNPDYTVLNRSEFVGGKNYPSAKVISFGPEEKVSLRRILTVIDKEFPDSMGSDVEVHVKRETRSIEICAYQKYEPLTPIESSTPGFVGDQFVWGRDCRVTVKELFGVTERYFYEADEEGAVFLSLDEFSRLCIKAVSQ